MSRQTMIGQTRRRFLATAAGWGIGALALGGGAALASGPDLNRLKRQVAEADLAGPAQLRSAAADSLYVCTTDCEPGCQSCAPQCQTCPSGGSTC
jgi:hypothetical protein